MTPAFEFATATRILFGPGQAAAAPTLMAEVGAHRVLVVCGRDENRVATLAQALHARGIDSVTFSVRGEPTVELVRAGVDVVRQQACDAVIAQGGGSAIDAGKAIAALATHGGDPLDHLEVIGRGQPITRPPLPFVAMPTTAGTGSEVTRNAVLGSPEHGLKASVRSPLMLPRAAIVDPDLLQGCPPAVVAASGLDALSQLIEPFLSAAANPLTDALARQGIVHMARSLPRGFSEGLHEPSVRADLALGSLLGGLCLANAGLGAVHGFAAPLGGMFDAPHGAVCAALLVSVLEVNRSALLARAPAHPALARLRELAGLLTGDAAATVEDGFAFLRRLREQLAIPRLAAFGLRSADFVEVVARARAASSMKKNPIALDDGELTDILARSL